MTLLVILGAGASHDIVPAANSGTEPPLTSDIFTRFGAALGTYPGATEAWNKMLHGLGTEGQTVETQLQRLRDESHQYDPLKRQLLAVQFFLQDVFGRVSSDWTKDNYPGQVNNLRYLVGELERWHANTGDRILLCDLQLRHAARGRPQSRASNGLRERSSAISAMDARSSRFTGRGTGSA